jgi:hypothetical protein
MLMAYFEERGYRHISRGNETRGYFGTILNAIGEQLGNLLVPSWPGVLTMTIFPWVSILVIVLA